ncbi:MAG: 1-acyl-sn-glycerol-3-phosphate acyltransferase [Deltaproteobacteria bacterium]|nr:1-acyl-sn-glycerol-3-phosphate acyltransferase [Deltaproteobacteria bacterium]
MSHHRDDVEQVLEHIRPVRAHPRMTRTPFFKVVGITFEATLRTLGGFALGRDPVAVGDAVLQNWWPRVFRAGNASLRVRGRKHLAPGQAYVIMSNHCSALDIPAVVGAARGPVRMVTKQELINVPLWGYAMHRAGFIPVDRKNRVKAIHQLDAANDILRRGVSVWISPEGTRARDGRLHGFKKGGFHIALGLGVPIVPAWIEGTQDCIAPDQLRVREDGDVEVRFGTPIDTTGMGKGDMPALMERVRAEILALSGRAAEVDAAPRAMVTEPIRKAS